MAHYTLKMKTLSPVHVGDGGSYDGMTAFEYNRTYIPLDRHVLTQGLRKAGIDPKEFTSWVIQKKQEREYRKPKVSEFIAESYPELEKTLTAQFADLAKTKLKNFSIRLINSDIFTCLKDLQARPYIPGSEIKGAIVTAIMYDLLSNDHEFKTELEKAFKEFRGVLLPTYDALKKIKALTKAKKEAGYKNYRNLNIPHSQQRQFRRILSMRERPINYIRRDLQRTLNITGSRLDEICDKIEDWRHGDKTTYNNKVRREKRNYDKKSINLVINRLNKIEEKFWNKYLARPFKSSSQHHRLMRFIKISDSNAGTAGAITNCLIIHNEPRITMDLFFEIIDSNTLFFSDCELDKNDFVLNMLDFSGNQKAILDKNYICKCLHKFSAKIIKHDLDYIDNLKGNNYRFPVSQIRLHLYELQKQNQPDSPLMRIGKGQGFLSLTLALLIKEFSPKIYGKLLGVVQSDKNDPDKFPVTRRILADGNGEYKFPGWLKLSFEETGS